MPCILHQYHQHDRDGLRWYEYCRVYACATFDEAQAESERNLADPELAGMTVLTLPTNDVSYVVVCLHEEDAVDLVNDLLANEVVCA